MTEADLAVAPDIVLVTVHDTTVAWVPTRREFFALTPIAADFVEAIDDANLDDLPPGLVEDLARQLRGIGVLSNPADARDRAPTAEPSSTPPAGERPGGPPSVSVRQDSVLGPYAALGHRFTVRVDGTQPELVAEVARVLADLATAPGDDRDFDYVVADDDRGLALWAGNEQLDAHPSSAGVLATLLWDVNRRAVASTTDHLALHAGAVVTEAGRAVVLPAAMEAGKTTLVTGLVRAGMGYLSDELAAVPDPGDHVLGYPKALSLDPGSWSLFPELAPSDDQRAISPNQWLVTADQLRPGAVHADPAPLGVVVFPTHEPGAATTLVGLESVEALHHLASCAFGFREHPELVLPRLARLAETVPAYRLTVGDGVDDAVDAIVRVAESAVAPASSPAAPARPATSFSPPASALSPPATATSSPSAPAHP